ncbi:MAG: type IV secretory system conjugative DNA transfer family protein [Pseudomonadota bacterium]
MPDIPELPRGLSSKPEVSPSTTASWFPSSSVEKQTGKGGGFSYYQGKIWLGRTATEAKEPVGWIDDRHMVTIAGSRTGKGVSAIIPALCDYSGSILCIDPKGENALKTAARRGFGTSRVKGMMQDVYVLDPYRVSGVEQEYLATFDPLAGLSDRIDETLEEAGLIADALVVSTNPKDAHFDDSARALIEAVILHVISYPHYVGDRSLGKVHALLRDGDFDARARMLAELQTTEKVPEAHKERLAREITAFDALLETMVKNEAFDGVIAGAALGLVDLGDRERGSILSTVRRNLKFLDAPKMKGCLKTSEHTLKIEDLQQAANGVSAFVVLPARLMKTHSRWMRVILNLTVARLEAAAKPNNERKPVLAILDEFPVLGHLSIIENAIGYMAGFGLKIWSIIQDLSQLKRDYPNSWETFLGNAGMIQCFGNSDQTTLDYISKRLGEVEVVRESMNSSETTTKNISDISDFEKVARTSESRLGSFDLQNSTKAESESTATAANTSQATQKTALLSADEVRRFTSRASGMQIVMLADYRPLYLRRTPYFDDPYFKGKYSELNNALTPPPSTD